MNNVRLLAINSGKIPYLSTSQEQVTFSCTETGKNKNTAANCPRLRNVNASLQQSLKENQDQFADLWQVYNNTIHSADVVRLSDFQMHVQLIIHASFWMKYLSVQVKDYGQGFAHSP